FDRLVSQMTLDGVEIKVVTGEDKRLGAEKRDIKKEEDDVEKKTLLAMDRDGLNALYCHTTVGTAFRTWIIEIQTRRLVPLFGNDSRANRDAYIDIRTSFGQYEWHRFGSLVKNEEPRPLQDFGVQHHLKPPYEWLVRLDRMQARLEAEESQRQLAEEQKRFYDEEQQRLEEENQEVETQEQEQQRLQEGFDIQRGNQQSEQNFNMQDGGLEEGSFSMESTSGSAPGGMPVDDDPGQSSNVQGQQSVDAPEEQSLHHIVQLSWHRTKKGGFLLAFEHEGETLKTDPSKWTIATDENNADCYQWHSNNLDKDFRAYTWPPS
ncbi:hypothetical protein COL154_013829, partial [Colletotrichum chrysophilum]